MSLPPSQTRQPSPSEQAERYARAVHNAALVGLIACPMLALLPPRKLDVYTLGLIGVTGYSANYLLRESSGRSAWQHIARQQRVQSPLAPDTMQGQQSAAAELQKQGRTRESWKIQRQNEIREDVEEGKSFQDMIMDQIWEVWNQGKTKDDEE